MPKIIAPDDMNRPTISDGSRNPASISPGVVSQFGASNRAVADSVGNLVGAFGDAMGRVASARAASSEADARLEWLKGDYEIRSDLAANAGEDGELYRTAPERYGGLNKSIDEKYGQLGEKFSRWREEQTWRRGTEAGNNYLKGQRTVFTRGWDQDNARLFDRVGKGEIDPTEFKEMYQAQVDKIAALDRKVIPQSEAQARARQLQAQLALSLDRYLTTKSPDERAKFWGSVAKGQYAIESGKVTGGPVEPYKGPIFIDKTPSRSERVDIQRKGGIVVNLDTNWAKGDQQTSPMVVIPDNATPEQRAAAEAYASRIAEVYKGQFGKTLAPRVVTRSENGRGRKATIHTEPFAVTDSKAVAFFNSPEGQRMHAGILQETFGKVPGVHFSVPHDPYGKGDRGAAANGVDEVKLAKGVLELMRSGGDDAMPAQPTGPAGDEVEGDPTAQPGTYTVANDNAEWDGSVPEGRLVEGQTFTVQTERGEIEVPAEWINAIPAKARKAFGKEASEALKVAQRQRKVLADKMIEDAEAHIAAHGTLPPRYSFDQIQKAYADNPSKIEEHKQNRAYAAGVYRARSKAADLPAQDIDALRDQLRPQEGDENFAVKAKIYEKAAAELIKLKETRYRDPAKAVEGAREVKSVRSKIPGGTPRNTEERIVLAQARMEAQTRLEILEPLRSPITVEEARGIAGGLSALTQEQIVGRTEIQNGKTEKLPGELERVYGLARKMYGDDYADDVSRAAIRSAIRDETLRNTYVQYINEYHDKLMAPPAAPVDPDAAEKESGSMFETLMGIPAYIGGAGVAFLENNLPDGVKDYMMESRDVYGQTADRLRGVRPEPQQQTYAKPNEKHIERLKANPYAFDQFEAKFGPGSAEKAVPGISRILNIEQRKQPANAMGMGQDEMQRIMRQ